MFTTPYRSSGVWLSVDVLGSPSRGTTSGRTGFAGVSATTAARNNGSGSRVPIDPGHRYEWEIRLVVPEVSLNFRRLPAG